MGGDLECHPPVAGAQAEAAGWEYAGRDNLEVVKAASHYQATLLGWIKSACHGKRTIVDFGAGAGAFAVPIAADGIEVLCVEIDPAFVGLLEAQGLRVVPDLNAVRDSSVDLIYAFDVLEHIEDDLAMLTVWESKLRSGGELLLYVPAFPVLFSDMDRKIGHFRRYRRRAAMQQLESVGFVVERAEYVDSLGFVAGLVYKWTSDGSGRLSWRTVSFYDTYVFRQSRKLDRILRHLVGKNLLIVGHKP
jgi:SAM-dependent methyltransferase